MVYHMATRGPSASLVHGVSWGDARTLNMALLTFMDDPLARPPKKNPKVLTWCIIGRRADAKYLGAK